MRVDLDRFTTAVIGVVKTAMVGVVDRLSTLEKRLDALPTPKDGAAGPQGDTGPQGSEGPAGKDGRDGQPGVPGVAGRDGEKGADGIHGKDGANGLDGLGFDDFSAEYDGERTFTFKFTRGEVVKSFPFRVALPLYRGTYDPTKAYEPGDTVTWGGSQWVAKTSTTSIAPDENSASGKSAWALSVMRGRQGKQGQKGDVGERGPRGEQGIRGQQGY